MHKYILLGVLYSFILHFGIHAQSNPELKVANGHRQYIEHAAASADERLLATAGSDGMIIWDLASGLELKTIARTARPEIPFGIPGSGDLGTIHDGVVRRINGQTLEERKLADFSIAFLVKSVVVDRQGKFVYIGATRYDGPRRAVLYQVNLQTGGTKLIREVLATAMGIANPTHNTFIEFSSLSVTPDGSKVLARLTTYANSNFKSHAVYNTQTGSIEKEWHAPYENFAFLTNTLLSHTGDSIMRKPLPEKWKGKFKTSFLQYPAFTPIKTIERTSTGPLATVVNATSVVDPEQQKWWLGGRMGLVSIDLKNFTETAYIFDTSKAYSAGIGSLLPLSKEIMVSTPAGAITRVNAQSGAAKPFGGGKPLVPVAQFANIKRPLVSLYSHMYKMVQIIEMGAEGVKVHNHKLDYYLAAGATWAPDGKKAIALKSYDNKLLIFDADKPGDAPKLQTVTQSFNSSMIAWSPDSKLFATNGSSICIWDATTYKLVKSFTGNIKYGAGGYKGSLTFSADGSKLAAVVARPDPTDDKKAIRHLLCFDVKSGNQMWAKEMTTNQMNGTIMFHDGDKNLSAFDKTIQTTYAVATGNVTGTRTLPEFGAFPEPTPDGKAIVGYSASGLKIIPLQSGVSQKNIPLPNGCGSIMYSHIPGIVYALSGDNSLHLIDMNRGARVGKLFTFSNNTSYAFLNSNNYFEGSEEATATMYFVKDNRILPLQSLFEKFYTPRLLQMVFNRNEPGPPVININTIKGAPTAGISYTTGQRNLVVADDDEPAKGNTVAQANVTITVQATAPGDVVSEIRLFQNGKLIANNTRGLSVADDEGLDKRTYSVTLQPGSNQFAAISLNSQRTESTPANLTLSYAGSTGNTQQQGTTVSKPATPAATTLHLLVVGINQYKNPRYNLNYAVADATAFKDKISGNCGKLVQKCTPYFISNDKATRESILQALEKIAKEAQPQDMLVFYYAGHGVMNEGAQKEFFLVPYDVTQLYGNDAGLVAKGISSAELQKISTTIKAQKQLFVLDACQSAGALQQVAMRGAAEEKAIAQLARSTGTHWLTASGSDQFASEFDKLGHGAFTYTLLKGLQGEAATSGGAITVNSLKAYIEAKVPEITEQYKGTPQYPASYGYGQDFPIGVK